MEEGEEISCKTQSTIIKHNDRLDMIKLCVVGLFFFSFGLLLACF